MKTTLSMVLILGGLFCWSPMVIANAPDYITCVPREGGFLPYNSQTGISIGQGSLFEKGVCHRAIDTFRYDIVNGAICSWTGFGWAPFNVSTGTRIGEGTASWFQLSTCETALLYANLNTLCVPRATGSGVYDINNGYFIGRGYYFDIRVCADATGTSSLEKVCAPQNGYSAIYNRRYNELTSNTLYSTAHQCGIDLLKQ